MRVNLRGGDGRVAEEGLHRADIRAVLQEIRGKGMAQGMRGDLFDNPGKQAIFFYYTLDGAGSETCGRISNFEFRISNFTTLAFHFFFN